MSNNHNEPRVYLNGKPCDFSEFSVSDDFLDAWLAEKPPITPTMMRKAR